MARTYNANENICMATSTYSCLSLVKIGCIATK